MVVELDFSFRLARAEDLENLEWFGIFRDHREIILEAYRAQERGENLILLGLHNGLPAAQCWVDLKKRAEANTGLLWALRVIPWLQGHGLGSRLIRLAERELARREYEFAELGVEKSNPRAELLYRSLGYLKVGELQESYAYQTPDGRSFTIPLDEWVYRKALPPIDAQAANPENTRVHEAEN